MDMTGEYLVGAGIDAVWAALNDPEMLQKAIPGCESIEQLSDTEMEATAVASVGPVKAKFKGKVTLSEVNPPHSYRLIGEGKGGAAGFAKGDARVKLEPADGGTLLRYEVNAIVGGKLAQIGQRFVDAAAKKIADDFFKNLSELVARQQPPQTQPEPEPEAPTPVPVPSVSEEKTLPPVVWIAGLTLVVALIILLAIQLPSQ